MTRQNLNLGLIGGAVLIARLVSSAEVISTPRGYADAQRARGNLSSAEGCLADRIERRRARIRLSMQSIQWTVTVVPVQAAIRTKHIYPSGARSLLHALSAITYGSKTSEEVELNERNYGPQNEKNAFN